MEEICGSIWGGDGEKLGSKTAAADPLGFVSRSDGAEGPVVFAITPGETTDGRAGE